MDGMVGDNGAVLTVPCTMETVYGGMLYNQALGELKRVRLVQLAVHCRLPGILRTFSSIYLPSPFKNIMYMLLL